MRKYRGLTKNGKWVYGWYVGEGYECDRIIPTTGGYGSYGSSDDVKTMIGPVIKVIPETVGQQVGLKDKKRTKEYPEGQEIYEEDIVKKVMDMEFTPDNCKKYNGAIGKVMYSLWPFGEFVIELVKGEENSFYYPDGTNFTTDELEVIGNIHQNSKLMEK